jgi:hypothetical protein
LSAETMAAALPEHSNTTSTKKPPTSSAAIATAWESAANCARRAAGSISRIWRHGIHVFPVLISAGLPESAAAIERMATFFKAHAAET